MKNKKSFFLKIGCIVFVASLILLTSILCIIGFEPLLAVGGMRKGRATDREFFSG